MGAAWRDIARDLNADDRLTFEIGRVARLHVQLDRTLRMVHQMLASPGPAVYLHSGIKSTDRLINDCCVMLRNATVDPRVIQGGKVALAEAATANTERNRVVHDMWLRDTIDGPETDDNAMWRTLRVTKGELHPLSSDPPKDLAYLETVKERLQRSQIQVHALMAALLQTPPALPGAERKGALSLVDWVEVVNGRFDVLPDGGLRLHVWQKDE